MDMSCVKLLGALLWHFMLAMVHVPLNADLVLSLCKWMPYCKLLLCSS